MSIGSSRLAHPVLMVIILSVVSACVTGHKEKDRTVTDSLNGENYSAPAIVQGVPVLVRQGVERRVSGTVSCLSATGPLPAGHVRVELVAASEVVIATLTQGDGTYTLRSEMNPEMVYQLHVKGSCGEATRDLPKSFKGTHVENFEIKP